MHGLFDCRFPLNVANFFNLMVSAIRLGYSCNVGLFRLEFWEDFDKRV